MNRGVLLVPILLWLLHVEPGAGQGGESGISMWAVAHETFMKNLETKLRAVEQLETLVVALDTRWKETVEELTIYKTQTMKLKVENEELKTRLDAAEKGVNLLQQHVGKAAPQIAFSASLANSGVINYGPSADKTLIFKRVFSNMGDAYDPSTGVFTAPIKGLFYFTFSTFGYRSHAAGGILRKNGVAQVSTYDNPMVKDLTVDGTRVDYPRVRRERRGSAAGLWG